MAWSCATWFREPCQVRKEAAVSGVPGAPQPTGPEWSTLCARAALQQGGVRGQPHRVVNQWPPANGPIGCMSLP